MKKLLAMVMIALVMLALVACGDNGDATDISTQGTQESPTTQNENASNNVSGNEGTRGELDFRALRDNETGVVVSLGDPKSVFDEAFGEAVQSEESTMVFYYLDGLVRVVFLRDGEIGATWIRAYAPEDTPQIGRFEIKDVYTGMTAEDLVQLDHFSSMQLSLAGAVVRSIAEDGEVHSSLGTRTDYSYSASAHVENDVVVRMDIQIPMNRR